MRVEWNRYRTLVDRLLGVRLTPVARVVNRNVSYEYMNRQMVWHTFTVCLLFLRHSDDIDHRYRSFSCSSSPSLTPANSNDPPENSCRRCVNSQYFLSPCAQTMTRMMLLARGSMPPLPRASVQFVPRTRQHSCQRTLRHQSTHTH